MEGRSVHGDTVVMLEASQFLEANAFLSPVRIQKLSLLIFSFCIS